MIDPESPAPAPEGPDPSDLAALLDRLKLVARAHLRNGKPHTLQPTALVHEAYLSLSKSRSLPQMAAEDPTLFLRIAAVAMRRILIDHERRRTTERRGAGWKRVELGDVSSSDGPSGFAIVALEELMQRLAKRDPGLMQIVHYRAIAGLTTQETADELGISSRSVERDWQVAKAWLRVELGRG
jgi:RNA polymerase sigma factor (TIGR02999 family)